ncbi:MFS transporter [Nocardioides guangzhouensis]|nr:MFS transporter [Nocardioides guangzhouensis]
MPALDRFLPPTPLARRLSMQSILFAIGEGTFLTGSAVFFTQIVGLTAFQVGLGLSISGVVAFALSVPMGKLADRVGPKQMWAVAAALGGVSYLAYPLIHGFAAFAVIIAIQATIESAGSAGRGAYTIDVFPPAERVRSMAFMRSALNIGFTLGALLGGIALATGSRTVITAVPLLTAAILGLNAVLIARLPRATHHEKGVVAPERKVTPAALRNRGFVVLGICNGVLQSNQILLNVVVPLWLVQETDAPHTLLAWLFGTNTVMAVLLQVPAARGSDTVPGALRAVRLCAASFVLSCALLLVTHDTVGWVSIVLIWLGHVTITGAELFQSAASWGLVSELSDPHRRGEYQGVWRLGMQFESIVGPAAFTFLALEWGTTGWVLIAAIAVGAAAAAHPAARAAQRYLAAEPAAVTA